MDTNGIITTFAGTGVEGFSGDGGLATSAQLNSSEYIISYNNNYYIADYGNNRIRKIDSDGIITTVAGTDVFNGDNILASSARINLPRNLSFDENGNLFFAEDYAQRVRKIDTKGIISTVPVMEQVDIVEMGVQQRLHYSINQRALQLIPMAIFIYQIIIIIVYEKWILMESSLLTLEQEWLAIVVMEA